MIAKIPNDLSIYTPESVKALEVAKEAISRDLDITDQSMVDGWAQALEDALKGLVKKPVPNNPKTNAPDTGDAMDLLDWSIMMLLSGSQLVLSKKKQLNN